MIQGLYRGSIGVMERKWKLLSRVKGLGFGVAPPIVENQMETKMEDEMESGRDIEVTFG